MLIHLVSLFHAQDARKYGIDEILKPWKILETTGFPAPFAVVSVHGTLAQITGDNLGYAQYSWVRGVI